MKFGQNTFSLRPDRRAISPRARRALARRGLDLASISIEGSGPNGRIVEADVLRAPETPPQIQTAPTIAPRKIAQAVPQLTLRAEVDASALLELHTRFGDHGKKDGLTWTPADFLICATARALRAHPQANRVWRDGEIVDASSLDVAIIGGATTTLLIPEADRLNLLELAQRRLELESSTDQAASENEGGAFGVCVADEGRADEISSSLQAGQSGVLSAGRIDARPFVVEGELCVRPTLRLCLNVDGRVLGAALAAEFLGAVVARIEEPNLLIFG